MCVNNKGNFQLTQEGSTHKKVTYAWVLRGNWVIISSQTNSELLKTSIRRVKLLRCSAVSTKYVLLNQAFVGVGSCLALGYLPYILVFISILPSVKRGKKKTCNLHSIHFFLIRTQRALCWTVLWHSSWAGWGFFFCLFFFVFPLYSIKVNHSGFGVLMFNLSAACL